MRNSNENKLAISSELLIDLEAPLRLRSGSSLILRGMLRNYGFNGFSEKIAVPEMFAKLQARAVRLKDLTRVAVTLTPLPRS